ncbi:MAG: excinuclease ABC subunit UvrC [Proteobacteria bacterium]|nr:excinuclease ABC subunit UvrC [Pseudomonadota bacterium]
MMTARPPRDHDDIPADQPDMGDDEDRLMQDGPDHSPPEVMVEVVATPQRLASGMAVIRAFWETLPGSPGVYRMLNGAGEVLYVGKARNLKARVSSYARGDAPNNRIARMIAETAAMEFVTTTTETDALLLEINLIKQLKPRYNVLMRDDKSFPFILITGDHAAPQILKHRGARNRKGSYFGPFASGLAVTNTLNALQRAFLLRTCVDSYYENRSRPCLLFQIKRCSAPCTGEISLEDYALLVREAKAFLSGKSGTIRDKLAAEMLAAAERLDFEAAARYRDRISGLSSVQASQDINPAGVEEADVFAIHAEAGQFCIEVFFFRTGQNWGNRAFFPRADKAHETADVLDAFVAQFYDERPAPRLILLSEEIENRELLTQALSERMDYRVEIAVPKRGEKRDMVAHALTNAREALGRRLSESASQARLLEGVAQAFGLATPPRRIDVFDNSHIMGTNAVGAMIVSGSRGFSKTHYRTFNIQSTEITPGDDYGMMREVMRRRFSRLLKDAPRDEVPDDPDALPQWPDLVLIDGGKGQLDAVRGVLAELGIEGVPLVGVAKGPDRDAGRESFFLPDKPPFKLPPRDPTLYFIQRLRDEAHRFAIGTHRARRKRDITRNPLDEIAGIGPARKRALLLHFGTAKAVSRASQSDLEKVNGINATTAKIVYDFFHEKQS